MRRNSGQQKSRRSIPVHFDDVPRVTTPIKRSEMKGQSNTALQAGSQTYLIHSRNITHVCYNVLYVCVTISSVKWFTYTQCGRILYVHSNLLNKALDYFRVLNLI